MAQWPGMARVFTSAKLWIAVLAAVVGVAAGAAMMVLPDIIGGGRERLPPTLTTGTATVGGPFELRTHDGKVVRDKDFRGRVMVVFFGYSRCRQACPAGLQALTEALEELGSQASDIVPILITIDPAYDTPERLAAYVDRYHPRMIGLTGSEAAIKAVAKAYYAHFRRIDDPTAPGGYTISHQALFYVIGRDGKYVTHFSFATPVAEIVALLKSAK